MKSIILGLAAISLAASSCAAIAQNASDKPISAMPPAGTTSNPPNVNSSSMTPPVHNKPGGASSTVVPGKDYSAGTKDVGDSSESNGMPGQQGAGASATMQSGHASNQ